MDARVLSNGVKVPPMLFGTFQIAEQAVMDGVVSAAVQNGAFGFDTSPSYHNGHLLSASVRRAIESGAHTREDFFLQSKIDSWVMISTKGQVRSFVLSALEKANLTRWDALLIHWPQPEYLVPTWLEMEALYREKIVRSIGVCNFEPRHFRALEKGGATMLPHICQNEIHPLNTDAKIDAYCRDNGILPEAHTALCRMVPQLTENALIRSLAEKYRVSCAQLILRWHIEHGRVPVVKTSRTDRIKENLSAFAFAMEREDVEAIDRLDQRFQIYLGSCCCPGY